MLKLYLVTVKYRRYAKSYFSPSTTVSVKACSAATAIARALKRACQPKHARIGEIAVSVAILGRASTVDRERPILGGWNASE